MASVLELALDSASDLEWGWESAQGWDLALDWALDLASATAKDRDLAESELVSVQPVDLAVDPELDLAGQVRDPAPARDAALVWAVEAGQALDRGPGSVAPAREAQPKELSPVQRKRACRE